MAASERRLSARKVCAIPLRFRIISNGSVALRESDAEHEAALANGSPERTAEGQALNVSERGMYFTSRQKLTVGQALEMQFVLPGELTGRSAEQVKCSARVMHVDHYSNIQGVGVSVERFEALTSPTNWHN
jgi:hypothetical protein